MSLRALPDIGRCCTRGAALPDSVEAMWSVSLRSANKAPRTVKNYLDTLGLFGAFLGAEACPLCCDTYRVEIWMADQNARLRNSSAVTRFRHVSLFFEWAMTRGVRPDNPTEGMSAPAVEPTPVPIVGHVDATAILGGIGIEDELDVRDRAILELFACTPIRREELALLRLTDVRGDRITVLGKGRRPRSMPIDRRTRLCLDDWLQVRSTMRYAALDWLWLTRRGRLTDSGVYRLVRRRGLAAGAEGLHPHRFRHTFAHNWLLAGRGEGDLMTLAGWRSRQMVDRYARSAAEERAYAAYHSAGVRADAVIQPPAC